MDIKWMGLKSDPAGRAVVTLVLDTPPNSLANIPQKIAQGKKFIADIKPYRAPKSSDQVGAIWAKLGDLAAALCASKDEIYEECLKRYGPSVAMRIPKEAVGSIQQIFRMVDVKAEREDGTVFVVAYKGLSQMNTQEASSLLDGVLDECREVGISAEVKHG